MLSRPTSRAVGAAAPLVGGAGLVWAVGTAGPGLAVAVGCATVIAVAVSSGLARQGRGLGPADRVTATRAALACGVAGLSANAFTRPGGAGVLVALTVVALVLDAVDGQVARRTGTVTLLGARFDMEVDAFLILVLSIDVGRGHGWWVLAIGLARYAVLVAGAGFAWLRQSVVPSRWRKAVAATQGVVLCLAASEALPRLWADMALLGSAALLAVSFGTEAAELWRRRSTVPVPPATLAVPEGCGAAVVAP